MKFLVTLQRHTDKTLSYKKCQNPMLTQTSYFGILKLLKSRSCTSCTILNLIFLIGWGLNYNPI